MDRLTVPGLAGGMVRHLLTALPLAAGAAGILAGGALFSFSAFVVAALQDLPAAEGARAMQAINDRAPRSALMVPLLGSAAAGAAVGALALADRLPGDRVLLGAGAALAVAGFAVTAGYHVPRNDALAALDAGTPAAAAYWPRYVQGWTRMNHLRVGLLLVSGVCLVLGADAQSSDSA